MTTSEEDTMKKEESQVLDPATVERALAEVARVAARDENDHERSSGVWP